jgi:hypothetical protein
VTQLKYYEISHSKPESRSNAGRTRLREFDWELKIKRCRPKKIAEKNGNCLEGGQGS